VQFLCWFLVVDLWLIGAGTLTHPRDALACEHADLACAGSGQRVDRNAKTARFDVHQYRSRIEVANDLSTGREGHGGDNHLVASFQTRGVESEMERRRGRVKSDRISNTDALGKEALEGGNSTPGGKPP